MTIEIPEPGAGRPKKYDFASIEIGGAPLVVNLTEQPYSIAANKVRSAAVTYGKNHGKKFAVRLTGVGDKPIASVYRVK